MNPKAGRITKRLKRLAKTFIMGDTPGDWRKQGEFNKKRWKEKDINDDD